MIAVSVSNRKFKIQRLPSGFRFPILMKNYIKLRDKMPDDRCVYCGDHLDAVYIYIIETLEEKKLLPDDFKMKCCDCYE